MSNVEEYQSISLAKLRLDPENPRLPREKNWDSASEKHLLIEYYRRYNLIELAHSIAHKGFTPRHAEALLVVKALEPSDEYFVVEGNRRLATLKLLTNADYRKHVRAAPVWDELANQASTKNLDSVPVVVCENRESLNDYLGFRHITGPTPWRPEAKARFIARLLNSNETISEVAQRIGSNQRTVRRFAEAHAIYTQALECDVPMDQVEAGFGVFYNALDRPGIRTFLGLGKQSDIQTLPNAPIPENCIENLKELICLLYGDEEQNLAKVIGESRDLKKLDEVLDDERGRRNLFHERDLERAWRLIGGGRQDLLALLESAHSRLAEANGQASEYRNDDDVLQEVRRVGELAKDMLRRYGLDDN